MNIPKNVKYWTTLLEQSLLEFKKKSALLTVNTVLLHT